MPGKSRWSRGDQGEAGRKLEKAREMDDEKNEPEERLESFVSPAGGRILCRIRGQGPGLVLLGGANSSAEHYTPLAKELAGRYTVYNVERRGRPGSAPQGPDYSLIQEASDAAAILAATGARLLFGHSGGAIAALETALAAGGQAGRLLDRLALYEPPFEVRTDWLREFEELLAAGRYVEAQVSAMTGIGASPLVARVDRERLQKVFAAYYRGERQEELLWLLRPLAAEIRAVKAASDCPERYERVETPTLLLWGSASEERLRRGARAYAKIMPNCRDLCLEELDHGSPRTRPAVVARELAAFFEGG